MYVLFLSRSKRHYFYAEHQTSPAAHLAIYSVDVVDTSPVICMMLITQLCYLPRLQISAVVTVLPFYVFVGSTGTTLPFTIVLEE